MTTSDPSGCPAFDVPVAGRRRSSSPFRPRMPDTLRAIYEQYCVHEARELVALLPREGRRAILRDELARQASGVEESDHLLDVDAVYRAARRMLPLPPYERWVPLYLANRRAYLERLGIPPVPAREAPVTVATRPLAHGWWAHLDLRRAGGGEWRGALVFHREAQGEPAERVAGVTPRTAEIFRGGDPEELRQRFLDFAPAALEGFLRSALP